MYIIKVILKGKHKSGINCTVEIETGVTSDFDGKVLEETDIDSFYVRLDKYGEPESKTEFGYMTRKI